MAVVLSHRKFLAEDEWRRLEDVCKRSIVAPAYIDRRDGLMIAMGLRTGARASEVLGIRTEDFYPKQRKVFIRALKGSKDREIVVPEYLSVGLNKFINDYQKAGSVFGLEYSELRRIWMWYRPNQERTFHSLRHTFGLNAYIKTKDLRLVQYALGHKNISNTLIYVDYAYSLTEMRRLIF